MAPPDLAKLRDQLFRAAHDIEAVDRDHSRLYMIINLLAWKLSECYDIREMKFTLDDLMEAEIYDTIIRDGGDSSLQIEVTGG